MRFEPTTPPYSSCGCSNHWSYWRLCTKVKRLTFFLFSFLNRPIFLKIHSTNRLPEAQRNIIHHYTCYWQSLTLKCDFRVNAIDMYKAIKHIYLLDSFFSLKTVKRRLQREKCLFILKITVILWTF